MPGLDWRADEEEGGHHRAWRVLRYCAMFAAAVMLFRAWLWMTAVTKRDADLPQHITLLEQLPPPPPPPEPEPERKVVEMEEADFTEIEEANMPPEDLSEIADDTLGVDADSEAGADSFGLRAKRGGRSLTELANAKPVDPMQRYAHYAAGLEVELRRLIEAGKGLRAQPYTAELRLWILGDGLIERCEVVRSTGQRDMDAGIIEALSGATASPPPDDMHQPIRIRIRSQAAS